MSRTVAWNVAEHASHDSNDCCEPVSVSIFYQYFLSKWHDAQLFSLIELGSGNFRVAGRTPVRTREGAYSALWHHIGSCGTRFDADPRVQDAPCVGSAEDEWTVVRLGRAYGHTLDANGYVEVPQELRPKALFLGRTWSHVWYYGDTFPRFAPDIVLEYRTRTEYSQRASSYVCSH